VIRLKVALWSFLFLFVFVGAPAVLAEGPHASDYAHRDLASESLAGELRLSPRGLGPIHFGMSRSQASAALGSPVDADPGAHGCSSWSVPAAPEGVSLTAFEGRLAVALLYQRGPRTTRGIQVGDGVKRLRRLYRGDLRRGKSGSLSGADLHLFTDEVKGDATFTIDFQIVKKRIAFISAGTRHVIETFGECV
jgi:hypothetical protein